MAFWNKDKKTNMEETVEEITVETATNGEEGEKNNMSQEKCKYMYIALDENGVVILDRNNEPFCKVIENVDAPDWPEHIFRYAENVQISDELCVVVNDVLGNVKKMSKDTVKKAKREIRDNAKAELLELAKDKIREAKEIRLGRTSTVDSGIKETQEDSFAKKEENVPETPPIEEKTDEKVAIQFEEKTVNVEEKKEIPGTADSSDVVKAIDNVGKQINEDLINAVDDLIGTMGANNAESISTMKSCIEAQGKRTADTAMRAANDASQMIVQKAQKNTENIIGSVNDTKRSITEIQDKVVSKVNAVGKRVTDMGGSIEGIEGKLHRLDQLDTITELLQNKGLIMSMEIPPVNADEEDIINLVRYSQKITEQLGYAARDMIRKQEAFKSQEEGNANEQKMMDQKVSKAHDDGVLEGKKAFVKQLISKYEDIDTIRESENNHIHVIWTLLMELGVVIDGEGCYEKGKVIDFSDADIERLIGTYSKLDGAGKYKVVKTGLSFQGEIICKAKFEKVNPKSDENKSEEPVQENTGAQKENEEPESNEYAERNDESGQNSNE